MKQTPAAFSAGFAPALRLPPPASLSASRPRASLSAAAGHPLHLPAAGLPVRRD